MTPTSGDCVLDGDGQPRLIRDASHLLTQPHAPQPPQRRTVHNVRPAPACDAALFPRSTRGQTTPALPPPRRTGSATAITEPLRRNSMPVAAPISGLSVKA